MRAPHHSQPLARLAVGFRSHRAGVDDVRIGVVARTDYLEATRLKTDRQFLHLGLVELAAKCMQGYTGERPDIHDARL